MRPFLILLSAILILSCNTGEESGEDIIVSDTMKDKIPSEVDKLSTDIDTASILFGNESFRNVSIEKIGEHAYRIKGEARVYEATINYEIEDGHNVLVDGFTTATKAAPQFGNFSFTVNVQKSRPNSTLMLVLYEVNAEDGSRRNELPIPLPANGKAL